MRLLCAWCQKEGKPALIAEVPPLDDPTPSHGMCPAHRAKVEEELIRHREELAEHREAHRKEIERHQEEHHQEVERLQADVEDLRKRVDP